MDERADPGASRVRCDDEDTVVALTACEAVIVEVLEQREHVFAARSGQIARARHGDRRCRAQLGHDKVREARDGLGKKNRISPDPDQIATLIEGGDDLAIQTMLGLELRGSWRVRWIAQQSGLRTRPARLLSGREPWLMLRQREERTALGEAPLAG